MVFKIAPSYLNGTSASKRIDVIKANKTEGRNTVLFDLDGTLLPVDLEFFFKRYMEEVAPYFEDLMPREKTIQSILTATYAMIGNTDPSVINQEAFADSFESIVGYDWETLWSRFEEFYSKDFPKLRRFVPDSVVAHSVVEHCVKSGWDIVLATNPVFPEVAVLERMRWCNIHEFPWKFVTTIDNMHFCKPQLEYYMEILNVLSLSPDDCVMVGNDVQEDMCAKKLGLRTFLVEDFLVQRGKGLVPDGRGTLLDVPHGLDEIFSSKPKRLSQP
jgi:FMN phosphatase YigB (HAD superfamily)